MTRMFLSSLLLSCLVFAPMSLAMAQDQGVLVLKDGQIAVTLSASDQIEADQDLLTASLRIEVDDANAKTVQEKINKMMKSAVEKSKKVEGVAVSTGQYYVYSYDPNPQPKSLSLIERQKRQIWKGSQTLDLKSKDSEKILDLVASIQESGFVTNGLGYSLSPEMAESYKDNLLVGALKKIQAKAALVAKSLGKSGYDIVDLNIDGSYMPSPMPMMRGGMAKMEMSMAADSYAAPVAEPGKSIVTLTVSARVVVNP